MLKGKNLIWVALAVGAGYWYWNKMKKDKAAAAAKVAAKTTPGSASFTGDLDLTDYQNATGVPKFGRPAMYPSGQNALGRRLSGY